MDQGPWRVWMSECGDRHATVAGVASDDFGADVALRLSGDFPTPEAKRAYAEWLVGVLNRASEQYRAEVARARPESD